jgi:hypothetical protein
MVTRWVRERKGIVGGRRAGHTAGMSQREDYADGPTPPTKPARRWVVIGPGVAIGVSIAGLYGIVRQPAGPVSDWVRAWGIIVAGPIAGLLHGVATSCACIGCVMAPGVLAHPVRPSVWTGLLTAAALTFWFLTGWATLLVMIYDQAE